MVSPNLIILFDRFEKNEVFSKILCSNKIQDITEHFPVEHTTPHLFLYFFNNQNISCDFLHFFLKFQKTTLDEKEKKENLNRKYFLSFP